MCLRKQMGLRAHLEHYQSPAQVWIDAQKHRLQR